MPLRVRVSLLVAATATPFALFVAVNAFFHDAQTRVAAFGPGWDSLASTAAIGAGLFAVSLAFCLLLASRIARAEARCESLLNDMNHRAKSTLTTAQWIAAETFVHTADTVGAFTKLDARLAALGRAYDALSRNKWESADARDIVNEALRPFVLDDRRIELSGPELQLSPRCATMISMALHELASNAANYGALSSQGGSLRVKWNSIAADAPKFWLEWSESGGPAVKPRGHEGFGSRLIQHSFAVQVGGTTTLEFDPDGVMCILECPLGDERYEFQRRKATGPLPVLPQVPERARRALAAQLSAPAGDRAATRGRRGDDRRGGRRAAYH